MRRFYLSFKRVAFLYGDWCPRGFSAEQLRLSCMPPSAVIGFPDFPLLLFAYEVREHGVPPLLEISALEAPSLPSHRRIRERREHIKRLSTHIKAEVFYNIVKMPEHHFLLSRNKKPENQRFPVPNAFCDRLGRAANAR